MCPLLYGRQQILIRSGVGAVWRFFGGPLYPFSLALFSDERPPYAVRPGRFGALRGSSDEESAFSRLEDLFEARRDSRLFVNPQGLFQCPALAKDVLLPGGFLKLPLQL